MVDAPDNQDKRLLERLNALKPSTVQLERQRNIALNTADPLFPELGNLSADFTAGPGKLHDFTTSCLSAEDGIVASESLLNGDAIEDLLASLDNDQQFGLEGQPVFEPEEARQADKTRDLLSGAYDVIQESSIASKLSDAGPDKNEDVPDYLGSKEEGAENDSSSDEEKDEAEAARYVEDLLKEIQANPPDKSPTESEHLADMDTNSKRSEDDGNLSTRLAALSLPTVPSDQPGTQSIKRENTNPECCCICYDTVAVKCPDCEGDQLFCVRCWWEMHMADGNESQHKAVNYKAS